MRLVRRLKVTWLSVCAIGAIGPLDATAAPNDVLVLDAACGVGDDSSLNRSRILNLSGLPAGNTVTVAPFSIGVLGDAQGLSTTNQVKNYVLTQMELIHAPYDLSFTLDRPASGNYQMVVIGSDCSTIANASCAGIAILDCSDNNPHNIGYTFPTGRSADELVVTTAQEMAHAYGLNHTTDTTDIMFPQLQSNLPNSYGSGPIPAGESACGGATLQNSHMLLLETIGPRGQDITPPTVAITNPQTNALVSGTTTIAVDAADDEAIDRVEIELDGATIATLTAPPFEVSIDEPDRGQHSILARVVDTSNNLAEDSIVVFAGECATDDDCIEDSFVCQSNLCVFMEPPVLGDIGDLCEDDDECTSGQCGSNPTGGPTLCTQDCTVDFDCPVAFDCLGGACFPAGGSGGNDGGNADGGDDEDQSPLGCLTSSVDRRGSAGAGWLLLGVVAVFALRTRRRG